MSDEQVEKTVLAMGPRQAAAIFAQLTPERAAAIGRKLTGASEEEAK
jgi:flagellar motility protein MotE (MotC chaperone)